MTKSFCTLLRTQLFPLTDGRIWARHDEWYKANYVIDNGLAWEGPHGPNSRVRYATTIPLGGDLFFVTNGQYESQGWKDVSSTYLLSLNVRMF